jgi:lambda repressor-like predicted transcriptional regulator
VNHDLVSAYLRRQLAEWFLLQQDVLPLSRAARAALHPMMDFFAGVQMQATLALLAHDRPLYTVTIDPQGECEVVFDRQIPKRETGSALAAVVGLNPGEIWGDRVHAFQNSINNKQE